MTEGHHQSEHSNVRARDRAILPILLTTGVAMFVVGFIVTVSALSDLGSAHANAATEELAGSSVSSESILLLVGMALSLSGLVFATAAPAAVFIMRRRRAGEDSVGGL